jgi:hypothetical protein
MTRRTWTPLVVLALALAGCNGESPSISPSAGPPGAAGGTVFIQDAHADAATHYDVWNVTLLHLNGSVVLMIQIDNLSISSGGVVPLYNVSIDATAADGRSLSLWAASVPDPSRAAPHLRYDMGLQGVGRWEVCQALSTGVPGRILHELPNRLSGLEGGGTVHAVSLETRDGQGTRHDEAAAEGLWTAPGGPNPYAGDDPDANCPLFRDPSTPTRPDK